MYNDAMLSTSLLSKHRSNLSEKITNSNCLFIFCPHRAPSASADSSYPYHYDRNIYYFSGLTEENCALVMIKNNSKTSWRLFIKIASEEDTLWTGKSLTVNKAAQISGLDEKNIVPIEALSSFVNHEIRHRGLETVYFFFNPFASEEETKFSNQLLSSFPFIKIENGFKDVTSLRLIKCDEEIELIKQALKITHQGIKEIYKMLPFAKHEYELAAKFEYVLKNSDASIAFPTIVASGVNALCLHHNVLNGPLNKNDLLLIDCGASYLGYSSDISRTIPISGKFNDLQKEVYQIVLAAQKMAIAKCIPGALLGEIDSSTKQFISKELVNKKLIDDEKEITTVFPHSIGHSLGLDTHDISPIRSELILAEGMIVTIEPGIYLKKYNIGVRIEDDILITKGVPINLSADINKEIEKIEMEIKYE